MINDCQEAGVPEPEFESHSDAFRIVFRKVVPIEQRFAGVDLNKRQMKALRLIAEKGKITRAEYEMMTGATERTAKRDLNDLVTRRILMKEGGGNNFWYVLPDPQHGPDDLPEQAKD